MEINAWIGLGSLWALMAAQLISGRVFSAGWRTWARRDDQPALFWVLILFESVILLGATWLWTLPLRG